MIHIPLPSSPYIPPLQHLPTSLHSTLHQMAWMVDVEVHAGFNGDVHTSWKSPRCFNRAGGSENNNNNKNNNNNNINAEEDTLYDNKSLFSMLKMNITIQNMDKLCYV